MKSNQETLFCDECKSEIKFDNTSRYIQLPEGGLDSHGIWFGHIGEYLWFHDEAFCSWGCFLKFVENWYKRAEHRVHTDAGESAASTGSTEASALSTSQTVTKRTQRG